MSYIPIVDLYKNKYVLMFKEVYSLEKIHGTSTKITWNSKENKLTFFSGGEEYEKFVNLFSKDLIEKFKNHYPLNSLVIHGECYGEKQMGMSEVYGDELKFIAFDVMFDDKWINVPQANKVAKKLDMEFVHWDRITSDIPTLTEYRNKPSEQAKRNGMGVKYGEGIIIRPLEEMNLSNGKRIIAKYKRDEYRETNRVRNISEESLNLISDSEEIAKDWVTWNRIISVCNKNSINPNLAHIKEIIELVYNDIIKEGNEEIVATKELRKFIGNEIFNLLKISK